MGIFNLFKSREKKSCTSSKCQSLSFTDWLIGKGCYDLAASQALRYLDRVAPLDTSIDLISTEIATINPIVFDTKKEEIIDDHPVLTLLESPNPDIRTREALMSEMVGFYLLTGNYYIVSTGNINRPPLEISTAPSQTIVITAGSDGYAENYRVSSSYQNASYSRKEVKRDFKYYNRMNDQEFYQIRNFNPKTALNRLYGRSPLNSIYYELEQYISASIHNLSTLERGGRPSGILKYKGNLTDDQRQRLKVELSNYTGSQNSGKIFIVEGEEFDFEELSTTNKEMEFSKLSAKVEAIIYKRLKVPLPLISEDTMTMSNLKESKLLFYDKAIIPLANRIYSELTNFLMYRYPNSENLIITYNENEILALEPRRNEELKKLQDTQVLTINEMRALIGYEPLDGGDDVYAPATNVPIASDEHLDNPGLSEREKYYKIMRLQVDKNGNRIFSDDEIKSLADRNGIK